MGRVRKVKGEKLQPQENIPIPSAQLKKPKPAQADVQPKSHLVFPPTAHWHDDALLPPLPAASTSKTTASAPQLETLLARASALHASDIDAFHSSSLTSETQFFQKIVSTGTLSDRLSALTLLIQSSPLHNIRALDVLKSMAERGKGKGGREESLKALRCVADWWVGGGAPGRKLRCVEDLALLWLRKD